MTAPVIEGPYLGDILMQPAAVRTTIGQLRDADAAGIAALAAGRAGGPILLTGMGSSYHALHPLALRLIARGAAARMIETGELLDSQRRLLSPESLVVAVSQSGRSAEIVRLLRLTRGKTTVIGVTNTPGSPLARRATAVVPLSAGEEFSVSCKTYLATLVALDWLGDALLGRRGHGGMRSAAALAAMEAYLKGWRGHVRRLTSRLEKVDSLFLVGRGASLAAAGTGGLIVKESAHFHAEGMSAAAFRHGPFEMTGPRVAVLAFEGEPRFAGRNRRLRQDVLGAGGRFFLAGPSGGGAFRLPSPSPRSLPLLELLPVEMMTLALAARTGCEAGRFEHASKVTLAE